jgi:hypothetical protein
MSTAEQNASEATQSQREAGGSPGTGADEVRDTERPEGTVDEDANPPLTDPTKTEVNRNPDTVPPQDTGAAVPPYEGRQRSSEDQGTPGRGENEQQSPAGKTAADEGSGHEHDDHGVGPTHTPGTSRAENKS